MKMALLYMMLIVTMAIWGFNIVAIKVLVSTFPTLTITALRVFSALLFILPLLFIRPSWKKISRRDGLFLIGISLTTIVGHQVFMSVGLNYTSAVNGGLILGTVPIVTSIGAALFLQERFNIHKVTGVILGFCGVVVIILAGSNYKFTISLGDLLFCCTVIVQAIGFILVKKISDTVDTFVITGISQFFGGGILFFVSVFAEPAGIYQLGQGNWQIWMVFIFSGVIATGAGHYLYNLSIREIGAGKSAIFLNLTPFFAILGSYIFLKESILLGHWLGFFLVVTGVLFGTGVIKSIFIAG
ncbi:DMT family transporter [Bacillus shivajii]|uniref:DMT family transporter n=1 Tax=Bacillus shivajii TaxID=1983719 RepID=UPI001CFA7172|nr:DMT family transporter [Bacillus shivajii]UCZ52873.1 DMT family transporter [Bacillus shivajii]